MPAMPTATTATKSAVPRPREPLLTAVDIPGSLRQRIIMIDTSDTVPVPTVHHGNKKTLHSKRSFGKPRPVDSPAYDASVCPFFVDV